MIRSSRRAFVVLAGLALAASACSSGGKPAGTSGSVSPSGPAQAAASAGPSAVSIRLVAFNPDTLQVPVGTTVTWTQNDKGSVHTVTSGTVDTDATGATTVHKDGTFDSGHLNEAQRFSFTFSKAGTYPYFCEIHQATMRGEVVVR